MRPRLGDPGRAIRPLRCGARRRIVRGMSALAATPGRTDTGRTDTDGSASLRREGAEKLTGAARFTDDLVVPGAWYGATVRAAEPHARLLGIDLDPAFDWSRVVVVTAADIPGDNVVALIVDDQPALVADEIRHVAEPVALVAAPDRALARAARDAIRLRTAPLPAVLDPLAHDGVLQDVRDRQGRPGRGLRGRRPGARGYLPDRPPGAAVPRTPGDDRDPARRRRRGRPRLAPVPLVRPHGAGARARPGPLPGSSSSRRRRAAGSGARRTIPRSSRSTPPARDSRPGVRSGWSTTATRTSPRPPSGTRR